MPNTDPDPRTVALPPREAAVQLARKRFGFEGLRPGQLEAIDAVLSGTTCWYARGRVGC